MNKSAFNELSHLEQREFIKKMRHHYGENNFSHIIELTENALGPQGEIDRTNRQVWYYRGISLDSAGRCGEASKIFKELMRRFPMNYMYRKSAMLCCENIARHVQYKFSSDRTNEKIETYYKISVDLHFPFWLVTEIYIDYLIHKNRLVEACSLANDYVEMSPYDYDYLKKGLEVGEKVSNADLLKKVLANAKKGLEIQPYREDLRVLVNYFFKEELTKQAS